jgi:molybdopterin biosynthesis enzyme
LAFVLWTRLEEAAGGYRVTLKGAHGPGFLPAIATANSLTIVSEGSLITPGDKVTVWPLNWCS